MMSSCTRTYSRFVKLLLCTRVMLSNPHTVSYGRRPKVRESVCMHHAAQSNVLSRARALGAEGFPASASLRAIAQMQEQEIAALARDLENANARIEALQHAAGMRARRKVAACLPCAISGRPCLYRVCDGPAPAGMCRFSNPSRLSLAAGRVEHPAHCRVASARVRLDGSWIPS